MVSIALFRAAAVSVPSPGQWASAISPEPVFNFFLLFVGSIVLGLFMGIGFALFFKLMEGLQDFPYL